MSAFSSQSKGGEIITCSFGPHSNWTSRCFWDLQERYEQLASMGPASMERGGGVDEGSGGTRGRDTHGGDASLVGTTLVGGQLGMTSAARQAEIAKQYASYGVNRGVHYGGGRNGSQDWPRAIFFDLKGSPISSLRGGSSRKFGGFNIGSANDGRQGMGFSGRGSLNPVIDATEAARSIWGGSMAVHRRASSSRSLASEADPKLAHMAEQQAAERRPAQNWSDRWYPRKLHSRSLHELQEFQSGIARFDVFTHGHEVLANSGSEESEEIFESFRCQLEDCDRVQGFQVFADCDSGFGGLCADFLRDFVREECRSATILTYGLMDSLTVSAKDGSAEGLHGTSSSGESTLQSQRIALRSINQALAMHTLGEVSSVFVPVHACSLHSAAENSMVLSKDLSTRKMGPLHAHHAASLLASAVDTVVLPFRLRNGNVGASFQSSTGGAYDTGSTMSTLVRTIVPRPGMNVASLLTNFSMPRHFPHTATPNSGEESFDSMHEYLRSRAPFHHEGRNKGSRSIKHGSNEGNVGHSAKSLGTGLSRSVKDSDLSNNLNSQPVLLWSLTGQGGLEGVSSRMQGRLANAASGRPSRGGHGDEDEEDSGEEQAYARYLNKSSGTSYGVHMVVRGYNPQDSVQIGRGHNIPLEGVLGLYLDRTVCPSKSIYKHVVSCPLAVAPNASRLRIIKYAYGSNSEFYTKEEDEQVSRVMEQEMRRIFSQPLRSSNRRSDFRSGWGESKDSAEDFHTDDNVENEDEMDWGQERAFRVEEAACAAALDVSPRVHKLISNCAGQIKYRTRSSLFQYAKGAKGVGADQFAEITEALLSKADNYEN